MGRYLHCFGGENAVKREAVLGFSSIPPYIPVMALDISNRYSFLSATRGTRLYLLDPLFLLPLGG